MTPNDPEALQVAFLASDVLGILRMQDDRVSLAYLRSRSEVLGVGDLLARALEEIEG